LHIKQRLQVLFLVKCFLNLNWHVNLAVTSIQTGLLKNLFSWGLKRPDRETDHSLQSSGEVKNAWAYISTLPILLHGVVLS
jgi:hypothetical protein